ncbi:MAG: hypothetical protein AAF687_11420 [Pseudomonadota bacterium]
MSEGYLLASLVLFAAPVLAQDPPPPAPDSAVEQRMERARASLAKRGLLEGAPTLESTGSLEALAPAMEKHCGFKVGSVLKTYGDALSYEPANPSGFDDFEKATCLFNVIALSGVTKFGFVGNEKAADDDAGVGEPSCVNTVQGNGEFWLAYHPANALGLRDDLAPIAKTVWGIG